MMRKPWLLHGILVTGISIGAAAIACAEPKPAAEPPAAVVNGEPIAMAEIEGVLRRIPDYPGGMTDEQRRVLRRAKADDLVDERLIKQFLRKHVPAPDPSVVRKRITELEAALKARGRSLADFFRETGQTEERLRADIAVAIQWNAYVDKRVSDAELRKCFEENRELLEGAVVRASHIAVLLPAGADGGARQSAINKLQAIRQEIQRGLDFAEAAKKYSEDASTAAKGGDLGYFPPGNAAADPFFRALAGLKVGQISDIVQTEGSLHLIKLIDRKAGTPTALDEVKEDVRSICAGELCQAVIAEQRRVARIEMLLPE